MVLISGGSNRRGEVPESAACSIVEAGSLLEISHLISFGESSFVSAMGMTADGSGDHRLSPRWRCDLVESDIAYAALFY